MSTEHPSSSHNFGIPKATLTTPATNPTTTFSPQAGQYYRVDSSRNTYAELWRDNRSPAVLIAWLSKLLRIKLPGTVNDLNVVSLRPFLVNVRTVQETLPSDVQQKFQPVMRELKGLGFGKAIFFAIDDQFHHSRTWQIALLSRDGRSIARINHRVEGPAYSKKHFFTEFLSKLSGNRFLYASSARAQLLVPALCQLNWNDKATTSQLWMSHRQKLDEARLAGDAAVVMTGSREVVEVLESHHEAVRDFHLARGVFSSMQGEDLAQAVVIDRTTEQARTGQTRHPEIMAQLDRLQKNRTNWTSALLVLGVSIGLFIGAGAGVWKWSWEMLLMIMGILLVHEAGHYIGMKLFKYKNVRMFFIPFLGAAVSGENYAAPAWKKVLVSLMGPLPGIFLGGLLGVAGMVNNNDTMMSVAVMTLILNALQLLPVLPLDGGHVMHTLIFSRNFYLDAIFQVIAVCLLVGLGAIIGDRVVLGLGAIMAIAIPTAFKVAKIALELRQQGFGPNGISPFTATPATAVSAAEPGVNPASAMLAVAPTEVPIAAPFHPAVNAEECAITPPAAEAIVERILVRFPKLKSPKQVAQLTLRVFEMLVTRPAGIAASVGFVFLHGASFIMALVLLMVFMIAQDPEMIDPYAANTANPTCLVDPEGITTWNSTSVFPGVAPGDKQPETEPNTLSLGEFETIIATFSSSEEARSAFDEVKQEPPTLATLVLFGQSVFLSLPLSDESARTRWFDQFDGQAETVFVASEGGDGASLTLACLAADKQQAQEIEERLTCFLALPQLCLIPPWASDDLDQRSEGERTRHETARATFCQLYWAFPSDTPELETLRDNMSRAVRRNNQTEVTRLSKKLSDLQNQLIIRELERIRDNETDPASRNLADRYIAIKVDELKEEKQPKELEPEEDWQQVVYEVNARQRNELGPLMGQLPLSPNGGRPSPKMLRYSTSNGYVDHSGNAKLLVYLTFEDVLHGAPAFLKWLKQHGCRDFKYEIRSADIADYYFDE